MFYFWQPHLLQLLSLFMLETDPLTIIHLLFLTALLLQVLQLELVHDLVNLLQLLNRNAFTLSASLLLRLYLEISIS